LLIVPILQWAKRHEAGWLSWINERTAFSLSAVVAFFGAVGIHFSFDPTAGTATIDGLTITGLLGGGAEWLKQFAAQHWGHRFYRALESVGGKV
jgi:hypothetical protein